jgi:hypothetical protein
MNSGHVVGRLWQSKKPSHGGNMPRRAWSDDPSSTSAVDEMQAQ